MNRRPWMPLWVADYQTSTTHLRPAEHGAYLLLMLDYWHNGCLPDDKGQLARIARMTSKEWAAAEPVLAALFGPGWRHDKLDAEIKKAAEISEERRRAVGQRKVRPPRFMQSNDQSNHQSTGNPLHTSHLTREDPIQEEESSQERVKGDGEDGGDGDGRVIRGVFNARGAS